MSHDPRYIGVIVLCVTGAVVFFVIGLPKFPFFFLRKGERDGK